MPRRYWDVLTTFQDVLKGHCLSDNALFLFDLQKKTILIQHRIQHRSNMSYDGIHWCCLSCV